MIVFGFSEFVSFFINHPLASDWTQNVLVTKLFEDLEKIMNQISMQETPDSDIENHYASLLLLFCLLWKNMEDSKIYSILTNGFYDKISNIFLKLIENSKVQEDEQRITK